VSASSRSAGGRIGTSSSRPAIAFPYASPKLRPSASVSPTLCIRVDSAGAGPGSFSNAKRGAFTAT
jgi:hypothetical protein